jgi:putative flippase GtrA
MSLVSEARGLPTALMPQFARYLAVSALALGLDVGLLGLLVETVKVEPKLAGAASYLTGLTLNFMLSNRYVFGAGGSGKSQLQLFAEFTVTGALGLIITWCMIGVSTDLLQAPVMLGKAAAVATSFLAVFAMRRFVVFGAASSEARA